MADNRITLGNFSKGLVLIANELDFPDDALKAGQNVDLSQGLKTRDGSSIVSSGSLPYGTVLAIKQGRYPTPEASKLIAQVDFEPTWVVDDTGPTARSGHSCVWDSDDGRVLMWGGLTGTGYDTTLWSWTHADGWTQLTTTGTPPTGREYHTAFYDATSDYMYVMLGYSSGVDKTDVYKLNCGTLAWSAVSCTGSPTGTRGCFRTLDRTVWVYDDKTFNTVCKWTLTTTTWSSVATTPPASVNQPPIVARYDYGVTYDATGDKIVVYGGVNTIGELMNTEPYILNPATTTWTKGAASPYTTGLSCYSAVACSGKIIMTGGYVSWFTFSVSSSLLVYTVATDSFEVLTPVGTTPVRAQHAACISDVSEIMVCFGYNGTSLLDSTYYLQNNVCTGVTAAMNDLYASDDTLPTTTATFESIYPLGDGAGTVNIAQLNDRVIITEGVNEPPLVFPGTMSTDASDWVTPKNVLARPNGNDAYDISSYVCDRDSDTVADVGNWIATGDMLVCLDMPKTSGLYVEVGTPNTGIPATEQVFYEKVTFSEYSEIGRDDLKGTITNWVQSGATATGQFTDGAAPVTIGPPAYTNPRVVKGSQVIIGGASRHIMNITNGGAGAAEVTLDDVQASGTVDYIYNTELYVAYTDLKGVITSWVQSSGATGHFTDGATTLSLGPGENCPDVVAGLYVTIDGTDYTIQSITGDGTAADAVTLNTTKASGTVSMIRTSTIVNSGIVLSGSGGAWSSLMTKTLEGSQIADLITVRQVITGAELSGDGSIIRVTWKACAEPTIGDYTNVGMKIVAASIVERSGTTYDGTTTPTMFTFNYGKSGAQCAIGGTITSDPLTYAIDNAKNYLIITDYGTFLV